MKNGDRRRKRVAVMFGGRSVEHEISVISALQLIEALDAVAYEPVPVYIAPSGRWYSGDALLERKFYTSMPASLSKVDEVTLLPVPGTGGLSILRRRNGADMSLLGVDDIIPIDIYFPAFHGTYGEDGCIQGLLELCDVAYVGCNVLSAALGMSKFHCKKLLESHGIPVLPAAVVEREMIEADLGGHLTEVRQIVVDTPGLERFPLFVKPNNLGSSIGIAKVDDSQALDAALVQVFKYDTAAIVEPCLSHKMEINVSVLDGLIAKASVVEIPISTAGQELTYEDKYLKGGSKKGVQVTQGMAGLSRVIDPADLNADVKALAQDYAVRSFKVIGCSGVARIDFMLDLDNGQLYFNEINTLPGSLSFYLWINSKPPLLYTEMLTQMIERAEGRDSRKLSLQREIAFQALLR